MTVNGLAPVSPKKKKSKKKKRDDESPTKSQGTVDLGALLKDSGIDFDDFGFGGLGSASGLGGSSTITSSAAVSTPTVATVIAPVPDQMQHQQQPPVIELNDSGPSLNSSIGSTSSSEAFLVAFVPRHVTKSKRLRRTMTKQNYQVSYHYAIIKLSRFECP